MTVRELFTTRMMEFNFLPSVTLHPSRHAFFDAPTVAVPEAIPAAVWHRHWSRLILRRLDLFERPVLDARRPELALALLPPDGLARVGRYLGAVLYGRRLRQVIEGDEIRRLMTLLGPDVLDFARKQDMDADVDSFSKAGEEERRISADNVDSLGRAAMLTILRGAGPELSLRAELKLADEPPQGVAIGPQALLGRALDILKYLEPLWHSSFPALR
ncbi:SctK family type III secretion system sorting platform protein [Alcaligenes sp. WGS1538]|uniref:SctK family type III secretion system sorting platform protein n=1 Tax=Alcaligenes sp. WGS1538 TaxID=3366811 RepID=UPI00372D4236